MPRSHVAAMVQSEEYSTALFSFVTHRAFSYDVVTTIKGSFSKKAFLPFAGSVGERILRYGGF
jgi:hypothetical protein